LLSFHGQPGDQVFSFCFSCGAFTARLFIRHWAFPACGAIHLSHSLGSLMHIKLPALQFLRLDGIR
jgi:hypothetical protein